MRIWKILLLLVLTFTPAQAQLFYTDLATGASTPCRTDFEDFLVLALLFNPLYDGPFKPIMDIDSNGEINFNDFILLREHFYKPICLPLDSILVIEQAQIAQGTTDGFPNGNTRIEIPASMPLRLANAWPNGKDLTFKTPIINLTTGETFEHTLEANLTEADSSLKITVQGIVGHNGRLSTKLWDLGIKGIYQSPYGSVEIPSPFSPAEATLGLRPFAPTDINLFTPGVYPNATDMVPASGDTLTEATAQSALQSFLSTRITNPDTVQQTLSTFSDPLLRQKIPNPTLRAGLLSLKSTLCESAIDAITRGPFGPITFGAATTGDYAEVQPDRSVIVDQRYRAEAFPLFGPIFARTALQVDTQTGRAEEIASSAILALVAMQQALTDSTIAQSGAELSRRLNTQMLARLNSGRAAFPNIGIYPTPDAEAFPNGHPFASYAAVFDPLTDIPTPASGLLKTYLSNLTPEGTAIPNAQTFNTEVLDFLDQHQDVLSPDDLIRIARILKLQVEE